jgi:biopolymer transport protein ExbD/biopolymer transport protein TolR
VVFAILIVFMITAPMMTRGVKVDLPQTEAPKISEKELLRITIDSEQRIYVGQREVDLDQFGPELVRQWDGEAPVAINSDERVPYGWVMKVVSRAQALGVKKVGFLTTEAKENKQRRR